MGCKAHALSCAARFLRPSMHYRAEAAAEESAKKQSYSSLTRTNNEKTISVRRPYIAAAVAFRFGETETFQQQRLVPSPHPSRCLRYRRSASEGKNIRFRPRAEPKGNARKTNRVEGKKTLCKLRDRGMKTPEEQHHSVSEVETLGTLFPAFAARLGEKNASYGKKQQQKATEVRGNNTCCIQ